MRSTRDIPPEDHSAIYINQTIEYARLNPHINVGQLVHVFNRDDPQDSQYLATGIVKEMRWDNFYIQYIAVVQLMMLNEIKDYELLAGCCERAVGAELRIV